MATVRLPTRIQAVLFECELQGQISDGHWENARPHNHWEVMSSAKVVVDEQNPGLDFRPRRRYNFAAPELLEVVEDRMIQYAQAAHYFPMARAEVIDLMDHGDWIFSAEHFPKYESRLAEIGVKSKHDLEDVKMKIRAVAYTHRDLRRDLLEISKIVNSHYERWY